MSTKVVLLIEDNPDDKRLTLRALRKNNIMNEVVVAYDGQEALDYLFAQGKFSDRDSQLTPSLIILDLKLPGLSGMDVLKRIRTDSATSGIPIVVLTGSDEPSMIESAYRAGANSYIVKPTGSADYSDMVLHIGMYWLLVNEAPPMRTPVA